MLTDNHPSSSCPLVIAHRGASGLFPENTLLAIQEAHQAGADLIEIDVRLTADNHVVVFHDKYLNRTTNGHGKLENFTLAKLKELNAGYRFSRDRGRSFPFAGTDLKIPLLSEVLDALPTTNFQIELKDNSHILATKVVEIIRARNRLPNTQIASAQKSLSNFVSALEPNIAITHTALDTFAFILCSLFNHQYRPHFHTGFVDLPLFLFRYRALITRSNQLAQQHNLKIRAYTINDLDLMKKLVCQGIAGFFTDYPAEARHLIDSLFAKTGQAQ